MKGKHGHTSLPREAGPCRLVYKAPTGSGKTVTAIELIRFAREELHFTVGFTTPWISLIEQGCREFERAGLRSIGVIQGTNKRTNPTALVQIISVATWARRDDPASFDLVIVDECHIKSKAVIERMKDPAWSNKRWIGLSATPWSIGLGQHFDKIVSTTTTQELIGQGHLSKFRVFAPPGPDLTGVGTDSKTQDYQVGALADRCNTPEIVGNVVATYERLGEARPAICYAVNRLHAQHLQERFIEAGIAAEYIDCFTPMYEREEIFERFENDETRILVNVSVLEVGMDFPFVGTLIDARPTKSRIRYVQTIGRGLRPKPHGGDLIILDHGDNVRRFGLVTGVDCDVLDDGENARSIERDPIASEPAVKLCPECHAVLPPGARECPQCHTPLFAATPVIEKPGELIALGSRAMREDWRDLPDDRAWYAGFAGYEAEACLRKGRPFSHGRVYYLFLAKFGRKPPWSWRETVTPQPPTVEQRNFVRSRDIAFAKSQGSRRYG